MKDVSYLKCNTRSIQYDGIPYDTMLYDGTRKTYDKTRREYDTIRYDVICHDTIRHDKMQIRHTTMQYHAVQYKTIFLVNLSSIALGEL